MWPRPDGTIVAKPRELNEHIRNSVKLNIPGAIAKSTKDPARVAALAREAQHALGAQPIGLARSGTKEQLAWRLAEVGVGGSPPTTPGKAGVCLR